MANVWIAGSFSGGAPLIARASFDGSAVAGPLWADGAAGGNVLSIAVSPNNVNVAICTAGAGLAVYPVSGIGLSLVPIDMNVAAPNARVAAWSPDSAFLAAAVPVVSGIEIWVYAALISGLARVATLSAGALGVPAGIAWSPDGGSIAYSAQVTAGQQSVRIFKFFAPAGPLQQQADVLITESTLFPAPVAWHPSGRFLATSYTLGTGAGKLMLLGWDGAASLVILQIRATAWNVDDLAWDPTGRYLAESRDGGSQQGIGVWTFDGAASLSGPRTPSADGFAFPSNTGRRGVGWSADGGWIASPSVVSNAAALYVAGWNAAAGRFARVVAGGGLPASWAPVGGTPMMLAWDSGSSVVPPAPFVAMAGSAETATDAEIRAGGLVLIFAITNAVWSAQLGGDNAITAAFLDGITGPEWTPAVRAAMTYASLQRLDDEVVEITLPAAPAYQIATNETVTVTIPGSAVSVGGTSITPSPSSFVVESTAPPPTPPAYQNTNPILQVMDPGTNTVWQTVPGVISVQVKREGTSSPGTATVVVAADEALDAAPLKRFYPFQEMRILDTDHDLKPFSGRIDTANETEDQDTGRVWKITGRDFLAVLADNYVAKGVWRSAAVPIRGISADPSSVWTPNYVGDYAHRGTIGESRSLIILDLLMNLVTGPDESLSPFGSYAPNSKPIEARFDGPTAINILDAIRDLARSDPWCISCPGQPQVDGKTLADMGFPDGSGFGAELQMDYTHTNDDARSAIYFPRGFGRGSLRFVYGPPDAAATTPIVTYSFDKQGVDLYSRIRPAGQGEARDDSGVVIAAMESTWSPEQGLFRARRETVMHSTWMVGDPTRQNMTAEADQIRARSLRDQAYAELITGNPSLANLRGGPNRGDIKVPGLPYAPLIDQMLLPGFVVSVKIPQIAVDAPYVIQQWEWRWPEDITTLTLARKSIISMNEQLMEGVRRQEDALAGLTDIADSGWQTLDGNAGLLFEHKLGVRPTQVTVSAAVTSADVDPSGKPIPILGSEVDVQALHWDGAQGQYVGYAITTADHEQIAIVFAEWLAYTEAQAKWLSISDPTTLVRVRCVP